MGSDVADNYFALSVAMTHWNVNPDPGNGIRHIKFSCEIKGEILNVIEMDGIAWNSLSLERWLVEILQLGPHDKVGIPS